MTLNVIRKLKLTARHNDMGQLKLDQLSTDGEIARSVWEFLGTEQSQTTHFYLLPKIHEHLEIHRAGQFILQTIVQLRTPVNWLTLSYNAYYQNLGQNKHYYRFSPML